MSELPFEIGSTYHRVNDIHEVYGGNHQRGISPSASHPYIFIFFGKSAEFHGYEDEFTDNGHLLYSGEGREGDMTMDRGNAAIRDHRKNEKELHVFEIGDGAWEVTYVGEYEYLDHRWTELADKNKNRRNAIRFELGPKGGDEIVLERDPGELLLSELHERAIESATGDISVPEPRPTTSKSYPRSEIVKRYAMRRADGTCEACDNPAPFTDLNGEPFLEVHHLYMLKDGGLDHPDNIAAICPNCHRRVHHGEDRDEYNSQLIESLG